MWKNLLKATDVYKTLPHEVKKFTMGQVGSAWYVYADFEDRPSAVVGRFKTYDEAKSILDTLKNLTDNKNRE